MEKSLQHLNICFYSVATHLGGGERSMLELVVSLKNLGHSPWILVPSDKGPLVDFLREKNINFQILPMPSFFLKTSRDKKIFSLLLGLLALPSMALYFASVLQLVREKKPHLIHTNGIKCHFLGSLVGFFCHLPVFWHIRDIIDKGGVAKVLHLFSRIFQPFIFFNSVASAAPFANYRRKKIVYNGVFLEPGKGSAPLIRRELAMPENARLIGILGVLARWKGQDLFLDLASRLVQTDPNIYFAILGGKIYDTASDNDYEELLKRKATSAALRGRVFFSGFVANPGDYLRQLDCLVHCSLKPEPFGRVIVEAMLAEIPVIAAAAGGVLEIIQNDHLGILYEPGNLNDLELKTKELLRNPRRSQEIKENALRHAREQFSPESHVQQILEAYRQSF